MRKAWRIWVIYAVCAAVLLTALGFVTREVVELAEQRAAADLRADFEKKVQLALWRLDSTAAPILSRENARPYIEYQATYPVDVAASHNGWQVANVDREAVIVSNALRPEAVDVKLHFQIDAGGRYSSPQVPDAHRVDVIEAGYTEAAAVQRYRERLGLIADATERQTLVAALPAAPDGHARRMTPMGAGPVAFDQPGGAGAFANVQPANASELTQQQAQQIEAMQQGQAPAAANQQLDQAQQAEMDFNYRSQYGHALNDNQYVQQRAQPQKLINPNANAKSALKKGDGGKVAVKEAEQNREPVTATDETAGAGMAGTEMGDLFADYDEYADELVPRVAEGLMRPMWLGERLVLARRVSVENATVVQGVWLDWGVIEARLLASIADVLPGATLTPLREAETGEVDVTRRMAALPVRLVTPEPAAAMAGAAGVGVDGPTRTLLAVVWGAAIVAVAAVGLLLRGAVVLSERRGAFVSAVTHELRTPLTTFRMYAEMLSGGMVSEEKQKRYLTTLTSEAGRLSHLVENVLAYARLERGRPSRRVERVSVGELIRRITDRLPSRCEQAGFDIVVNVPDSLADQSIETDTSAVEQVLYNLTDNACKYAATAGDRRLHIEADRVGDRLRLRVRDHGPGIDPTEARKLFKPFTKSAHDAAHSAPGVGLGLAISRRLVRSLGGDLRVDTSVSDGACFEMTLPV